MVTKISDNVIDVAEREIKPIIDKIKNTSGEEKKRNIDYFFSFIYDVEEPEHGKAIIRNLDWLSIADSDGWTAALEVANSASSEVIEMFLDLAIKELETGEPQGYGKILQTPVTEEGVAPLTMAILTLSNSNGKDKFVEKKYFELAEKLGLLPTVSYLAGLNNYPVK